MAFTRGTIVKSFFWKFCERISVQLIQFVVTLVLARLLMPSEYGIIALIVVFVQLCDVIIESGLNTALIQKKDADNIDFSTIFFFSLGVSIVLYGIMYIVAPIISAFYKYPELIPVIRIFSLSLPLYAFNSIQRAYVSRNMLFRRLFYCSFGSVVLSGGLGIVLAYHGFGVWALVAQSVGNQLFTTLIMWFTIRWRPDFCFSIKRFMVLFNYGWKILCASFITTLFVNIRKLIIGKFYTSESLAYYEKGEQLPALVMNNILASVQSILLPAFSSSQDNRHLVKAMMRRCTKMSCFFIYPLMVGMIVAAKPLILLLLTDKWLPVVPFVQILCVANFFRPITIPNWEAIKALGYSNITLKLEIIKKIVDIIILSISALMGTTAIAWGCVLFNLVCVFINLAPNKRILDYGIKEQLIDALPTLVFALVMGVSIFWIQYLDYSNIVIILLQLLIGGVVYLGICWLFKDESLVYILHALRDKGMITRSNNR